MRRIAIALSVVSVLLLLDTPAGWAAGGGNPPPFIQVIVNPAISATILVDTHQPGITPTAGQASIYLRNGNVTTQAFFNVNVFAQNAWVTGCNLHLTAARFLWAPSADLNTLFDWVPPFVLDSLFLPFGITPNFGNTVPAITQISNAQCLQSPAGADAAGWLLMNATIQFLVPAK